MPSYVQQVLSPDEQIFYQAKLSLVPYAGYFLVAAILLVLAASQVSSRGLVALCCAGVAILFVIWPLILRASTEIAITSRRVIEKRGALSRSTVEINFHKIESIGVNQSLGGRLFNFGDIVITGTGSTHEPIRAIADPLGFRRAFDAAQSKLENSR